MRLSILQQMYLNQTELYRSSFSFYYIQIKDELSIQPHSQVIHFQHFNGKKEGITIGKNQLNRSHDIVIDYANTLYIADSYNNQMVQLVFHHHIYSILHVFVLMKTVISMLLTQTIIGYNSGVVVIHLERHLLEIL